ncbi:MAG: YihY/virulence factor BrkB family protein [Bacteroidetes bacterium]|nr:MAG: YihY/virulence factor BrkB family protein [Bacteroidota bacterium]
MTTPPNSAESGKRFIEWKPVRFLIRLSKRIVLPGFDGMPMYVVIRFFFNGLVKGYIGSRASAISFSFVLAIFPFFIFLFTIIPFIPIQNFQTILLDLIRDFLPHSSWQTVQGTLVDVITRPRSGLLVINLILALYFSTNGINSLIEAFNHTAHTIETRTVVKQYLISILLVIIQSVLLILAIGLTTFGSRLLELIFPEAITTSYFYLVMIQTIRWLIVLALLLTGISFLYFLAPAKHGRYRFISAGSMLATILVIITTLGFNFYVDNFARYNALYGSIGTLLMVLVWIYLNSISLLIGFELNASIMNARDMDERTGGLADKFQHTLDEGDQLPAVGEPDQDDAYK